jgi:hypothetical protein
VRDTIHSQSVKSYVPYDHRAIHAMVDQFYAGRKDLAGEVDWWLAFEIWRQSLAAV